MDIDWFTLAAQIVNFLLLAWLLKKVLYKPVLKVMAKRQEGIAVRLQEAHDRAREAGEEKERYLSLQEELRAARASEMQRAKEAAEKFRNSLQEQARQEIESQRRNWRHALELEKSSFLEETSRTIATYFQSLATDAFRELADSELEDWIVKVFIARLGGLPAVDRENISRKLQGAEQPLLITTAFSLSKKSKKETTATITRLWPYSCTFEFKVDTRLLAGINLEIDGIKIHWDLGEYLQRFNKKLLSFLERETLSGDSGP